jgi:hypothetical protein
VPRVQWPGGRGEGRFPGSISRGRFAGGVVGHPSTAAPGAPLPKTLESSASVAQAWRGGWAGEGGGVVRARAAAGQGRRDAEEASERPVSRRGPVKRFIRLGESSSSRCRGSASRPPGERCARGRPSRSLASQ